jgi:hypothetical protein
VEALHRMEIWVTLEEETCKSRDSAFFCIGCSRCVPRPFEDAAFALKVGEMSGIVDSDSGVHLIKRLA